MAMYNDYGIADRRYDSLVRRSCETKLNYLLYKKLILKRNISKPLEHYSSSKISKQVIKIYADDYQDMKSVRERNRGFKAYKQKETDEVYNFFIAYREYFSKEILNRKRFREDFYYKDKGKEKRVCHYCKITEKQLELLANNQLINTKRYYRRGKTMEVDKIDPNGEYTLENIVLACYMCNNAKSDEFSVEEFEEIGVAIGRIWSDRLQKIKSNEI